MPSSLYSGSIPSGLLRLPFRFLIFYSVEQYISKKSAFHDGQRFVALLSYSERLPIPRNHHPEILKRIPIGVVGSIEEGLLRRNFTRPS